MEPHTLGPAWALAIQASPLGETMRASVFLYPVANVLHTLALGFFLGPIVLLDLRLLGLGRSVPLLPASRLASRVAAGALVVLIATGVPLFAADAAPLAVNPAMQWKAAFLALGVANALAFEGLWRRRLPTWDARPPPAGRLQATLSILAWLAVAGLGRLIAYV